MSGPLGTEAGGAVSAAVPWLPEPRANTAASHHVGGRIVVADDDPTLLHLVSFQLSRGGATVLQAGDGATALAMCREPGVELAVLDVDMPHLTGFEVLDALKSDPATAELPVLLLTAHTVVGGAVKGIRLGAHDYVRKPFDLGELQARVDAAILLGRRTRELARSEQRFRTLLDLLPGTAVVVLDFDLRIVSAGGTILRNRPADAPALEGMLLSEVSTPEDFAAVLPYYEQVMTGRGGGLFGVTSSSGMNWLVDATVISGEDGSPQLLVSMRDATELMRAQHELKLAEERFHGAFDDAPVGIVIIDRDGNWLQFNEAVTRITGYTLEQLGRMTYRDLLSPEDAEGRDEFLVSVAASGEPQQHQLRIRHAEGHLVWVTSNVAPLRDEQGAHIGTICHLEDITERKRFEAQLAHLADHDPLTGLLNRRGFEVELDRQAAHVARYGPTGALLVLDVDHFKQVNDTLGHNAGDELVASMGELLRRTVRETDIVARLGGDEFAVILPQADHEEAEAAARKIVEAVRARVNVLAGAHERSVTASVGIAMFDDRALSGEAVLVNADLTMYDAKEAGRDRYAFHSNAMHKQPRTKAKLAWVDRLKAALDEERFVLYAQPVLDLHSGRTTRHELLLRLVDDGEVIKPGEFLSIAERFGLIGRIDRWVVSQAIDLLAGGQLPAGTALEVNLSGLSVGDPDLLTLLEERLAATGADPSRLVFEITETAAVGNMNAARLFAERLASIGCRFALDDFGAGFGSFYYLKHLPFDFIKIDGEFIAQCLANATDRLVIQALVSIARGLGKRTIAEFVGDEQTLRFVSDQGVDFAQGYHVGQPRPVTELLNG